MSDLRKAAEMALEALENYKQGNSEPAKALRQALAQPEQEPECVGVIGNWGKIEWREDVFPQLGDRLYSAPPKREWQGLTDEESIKLLQKAANHKRPDYCTASEMAVEFGRLASEALKEKNNG